MLFIYLLNIFNKESFEVDYGSLTELSLGGQNANF